MIKGGLVIMALVVLLLNLLRSDMFVRPKDTEQEDFGRRKFNRGPRVAQGQGARTQTAQGGDFKPVEGPDLKSRLEAAARQAASGSAQSPFVVGYTFKLRQNVTVNAAFANPDGSLVDLDGAISQSAGAGADGRASLLLTYEAGGGKVSGAEIRGLDRGGQPSGGPGYWLGQASNEESVNLLRSLVAASGGGAAAESLARAIALHEGAEAEAALRDIAVSSSHEAAREAAVRWLGRIPNGMTFLADAVRESRLSGDVRRQALHAIARSLHRDAFASLQNLYESVGDRQIKEEIIMAAQRSFDRQAARSFLSRIASSDPDPELRRRAEEGLRNRKGIFR